MQIELNACSYENSLKLKELGIKQDSLFYWIHECDGNGYLTGKIVIEYVDTINYYEIEKNIIASAFTFTELLNFFEKGQLYLLFEDNRWICYCGGGESIVIVEFNDNNIVEIVSEMLISTITKNINRMKKK